MVFCPLSATSCERNASTARQCGTRDRAARHGPAPPRCGASQSGLISSGRASFLSYHIGTEAPALQSLDEMKSQIHAQHRVCTGERSLCVIRHQPSRLSTYNMRAGGLLYPGLIPRGVFFPPSSHQGYFPCPSPPLPQGMSQWEVSRDRPDKLLALGTCSRTSQ